MYPFAKCEHASGDFKEVMRGFRSERPLTAASDGGVKSEFSESETLSILSGSGTLGAERFCGEILNWAF